MKTHRFFLTLLLAIVALSACKKDPITPEMTIGHAQYVVPYMPHTFQIKVKSNVDFEVTSTESWLHYVSKTSESEEHTWLVKFALDSNAKETARTSTLTFRQTSGDQRIFVTVMQMPYQTGNTRDFMTYRRLFADDMFSELVPNISEDTIMTITIDLLRDLALKMYRNEYSTEFRVQTFKPIPHPNVAANSNKHRELSLLDNPTGMLVDSGEYFVVFAGNIPDKEKENVKLRVIDFSRGYGASTDYPLNSGVNRLKMKQKGLAYMIYHTSDAQAKPIDIHFMSGEENGYFDISKHTQADWTRLLDAAKSPYFDVMGKYAQLIFPVENFKNHTPDPFVLMNVYDSIIFLEEEHLGLYKYNRKNPNKLLFHVDYNTYMYMSNNRTAYDISTMPHLCNAAELRSSWIWGPAHEAGHIFQTQGLDWVGMGEVSNNIMSMCVQTALGNRSRLLSVSSGKNDYQRGADSIAKEVRHAMLPVFVKLVPFWQLELYLGRAQNKPDFYKDVYEKMRTTTISSLKQGEKQLNFVKVCSDVAQLNLFDFFEAWGFLRTIDMEINDYSTDDMVVTQEMIDEMRTYLSQYPNPPH